MPPSKPQHLLERSERAALCDLLTELGSDAPTLCEGWTTSDLAIHLVLIERRPDSWFGIPMGDRSARLRRHFDGLVDQERARPWPELVARLRQGPTRGPIARQWVRERMLIREFLIHHEDVRRANGHGPRAAVPQLQEVAWSKVPAFARRMLVVDKPYGLRLVHPDGRVHTIRQAADTVTLAGEPIELLLYAFGRTAVAEVDVRDHADRLRVRDTSTLRALPRVRGSTDTGAAIDVTNPGS